VLAPAKINLMLHVTGRRADGFHLLQSLVVFADVGDEVLLEPSRDHSFHLKGAFASSLGVDDENLVTKAAHALADACNTAPRGRLTLIKQLPIGAGLGGGSSDAAVALELLSEYWGVEIPGWVAAKLGSDVPACLLRDPCWMEGVGERITPLQMYFDLPALLVNPRVPVSTQAVYQKLQAPYDQHLTLPKHFDSQGTLVEFLKTTRNALETPALATAPIIADVLAALGALPGCELARMSGSGGTCFGIFRSMEECERAKKAIQISHPDWWITETELKGTYV
jgi:4-diphosphocytidyl-2-C-methyl-D-erythritol kinase